MFEKIMNNIKSFNESDYFIKRFNLSIFIY